MRCLFFSIIFLCCIPSLQAQPRGEYLANPQEIELKGNIRRESISSTLGPIELRWPRKVEELFGKTPSRATIDAAKTASRSISRGSFPSHLQKANIHWQIIFLDENLPETQIPAQLISNCHPGWMTPPGNIYIVAQRVAAGCESGVRVNLNDSDRMLARVMIHEMGHALEYLLLEGRGGFDRIRGEGFATWFEAYAADNSSLLSRRTIYDEQVNLAKQAILRSPSSFSFQGSAFDYSRASMYFHYTVSEQGLGTLMDVYNSMRTRGTAFLPTLASRLQTDGPQLEAKIQKFLKISLPTRSR